MGRTYKKEVSTERKNLCLSTRRKSKKLAWRRRSKKVSFEEEDPEVEVPELLPDHEPTLVDESIVKIEIEEEPLRIENDLLTSDIQEDPLLSFIKDEPSEEPDQIISESVDQLDECERQSIQMFFDSMARTVMTLSPSFVSRIKLEVLRVVTDMEMEAHKEKVKQSKDLDRIIDKVPAASNETIPRIKIEIEDVAEAEASNEPESLDPDHDVNYEPLTKKKKKSKPDQPATSSSAITTDKTPRTLHEPVETFFQSIAYTVKSFPPTFVCKAKVAVLKVVSKMEVEACRSRQNSSCQDSGGGADDSTTSHLFASGSS